MIRATFVALLAVLAVGCKNDNPPAGSATASTTASASAAAAAGSGCDDYVAALKKCGEQNPAFKKQLEVHEKAWSEATEAQRQQMDCKTGLATLKQNSCKF